MKRRLSKKRNSRIKLDWKKGAYGLTKSTMAPRPPSKEASTNSLTQKGRSLTTSPLLIYQPDLFWSAKIRLNATAIFWSAAWTLDLKDPKTSINPPTKTPSRATTTTGPATPNSDRSLKTTPLSQRCGSTRTPRPRCKITFQSKTLVKGRTQSLRTARSLTLISSSIRYLKGIWWPLSLKMRLSCQMIFKIYSLNSPRRHLNRST